MEKADLAAWLVPHADAYQGEYLAPCDERLAWLTGFTGSAGFAAITAERAGVFADGRYKLQVRAQIAEDFTPLDLPEAKPGEWLAGHLPEGARVGFDPWLHTAEEVERLEKALGATRELVAHANLIDAIWSDRPAPPEGKATAWPKTYAGEGDETKRARIAEALRKAGQAHAVLTLPDSISWLLNIRGSDIPRNPVVQAMAILSDDGQIQIFAEASKFADLGPDPQITVLPPDSLEAALTHLSGPVRVDRNSAPAAISRILEDAGVEVAWDSDPCILPKARKSPAEISATREAHLRDGAAMVNFLTWFDAEAPTGGLTEIDAARALEGFRRETGALLDISFDTISGAGPHGAIVHYRVTEETNRGISPGELYLVDSGGQYIDGTTDITRTIAVGEPPSGARGAFTRVLQGMIAISTARFPRGIEGRHLDALARAPLWRAGLDYDHGTGHGVGVYLSVHEGPQGLSRRSNVPLEPGMIVSNEPGYYREGEFGIRIENLVVVREADKIGDARDQLSFETLTWVPIDTRLVDPAMLAPWERDWLNAYHAEVAAKIGPRVDGNAADWLARATAPI
jgi:Xaa-Pro aminopeptidase